MPKPDGAAAPWRLRLALLLVRLAGVIVPRADREDWRAEWEGELRASAAGPEPALRRLRAVWGVIPDAYHLSREGLSMGQIAGDIRYAFRSLRKRPGFAAVAVATLGIGIGANAVLFSVVNGVLLSPFPYPEAERVVRVVGFWKERSDIGGNVSYPNLSDVDRLASSFSDVAGAQFWRPALLLEGSTRVLIGSTVTGNYFDVFGMPPALGRLFRDDDAGGGRAPTVVLGYRLWATAFNGDSGIVGRTITLNNTPYTVLGVTAEAYEDPEFSAGPGEHVEVWRTVDMNPADGFRSGRSWVGAARIRPGVGREAAEQELGVIMARLAEEYPEENAKRTMGLTDLKGDVVGSARPALLLLLGAVGVVLLIACANVASLLLSRALERRHEMAIRMALGGRRARLLGQLMVESILLAALGGTLGLAIAAAGTSAVVTLAGTALPRAEHVHLSLPVLWFTLVVAIATALVFGLAPAYHAVRGADSAAAMAVRTSASKETRRLHRGLVVGEIALSMVLLVGATLLVTTLRRLTTTDLGLDRPGVIAVGLHGAGWWDLENDAATVRYREILERIDALPGVEGAGAIDIVPLSSGFSCDGVRPEDRPPPAPGEGHCAEVRAVMPGATEALGIPLRAGRPLAFADDEHSPRVMVVSAGMAESFWPGKDPIGERASIHGESFEVVGVVGDISTFGPGEAARPMVYLAAAQEPWNGSARGLNLLVRGASDVSALVGPIREVIRSIDPTIPLFGIRTLDDLLSERTAGARFRSVVLSGFAGVALLLAVVGIGGVLAYAVRQRYKELGIRQALGASPGRLRAMIVGEGLGLVLVGAGVGAVAALGLSSLLRPFLFEVSAREPVILLGGAVFLTATVLLGCYFPARRAARIDPVAALRSE